MHFDFVHSTFKDSVVDTTQWIVTGTGLVIIIAIGLIFFSSSQGTAMSAASANGTQTLTVVVKGGYRPSIIHVERNVPVRLIFDRQEHSSCSEELIIPSFGIRRALPAHEQTTIEFTPTTAGTFEFTCGMNMLRGSIIVN